MNSLRLIKLSRVQDLTALQTTSVYAMVKSGLLTPPIKLTQRASAWVESEVLAINAARIAGKSDEEIRNLVRQLISARSDLAVDAKAAA